MPGREVSKKRTERLNLKLTDKANLQSSHDPSPKPIIPLFTVHMPPEVDEPLLKVLHSGYVGQGPKVEEFETILKDYFGTKNVLTLNNGTAAIHLALRLAGVQPGDEVISTPMTCTASNLPILAHYAEIVWADIDPANGLIDPLDVERKITSKTKAILCVDWGGMPCDLDHLMTIGEKYGLKVIEDAAHAFGATYKGKKVGTVVDLTCFSLQAIKHVTTIDGGVLLTKSSADHDRGKILRWYGIDREATNKDSRIEVDVLEWGYKFHMNDVTATIGLVQMSFIDQILKAHRDNAAFYKQAITNPLITHLKTTWEQNSSYWIYTVLLANSEMRQKFMDHMKENGVMTSRVHGRNDIHTAFAKYRRNLPGVKEFDSRQIAIPVHWKITPEERQKIAELCNRFENAHPAIDGHANQAIIASTLADAFLRTVIDLKDAMEMRKIRNECNRFMTHDTSTIGAARQKKWFLEKYLPMAKNGEMTCYLICRSDNSDPIGYGVVRFKDGKYWLTGGLLEKYRGQGYGQFLFNELVRLSPDQEVWLDVLETNDVGRHIYEKLGFVKTEDSKNDEGKNLVIMKLLKNE